MKVADRPDQHRYEIDDDGEVAGFIAYRTEPGTVDLVHTDVDPRWEGKGVGSELVRGALEDIRARNLKVKPSCSFVREYIERHPEYDDLVAP